MACVRHWLHLLQAQPERRAALNAVLICRFDWCAVPLVGSLRLRTPTEQAFFRWQRKALAGPAASQPASATSYRRPEDIGVRAVIVAPFKLGDIERQILLRDVMERAENATLQERPEAVNGLRVDVAPDVFAAHVVHAGVRDALLAQAGIQAAFVGSDQIDLQTRLRG